MKYSELNATLHNVRYKNWEFHTEERKDCFVLQVRFWAYDPMKPNTDLELQHARKWFISKHACKAEIIRTALKAVLAAEEHEACENFMYKGAPIHSPHLDPDRLRDIFLSEGTPYNKRKKQKK